ncbi:MAG: hypothetical protein JSV49_02380 [Thermoplasmata archaeon]|nr:MAG: hypothetical protein JSV49_02380 [Thermoplasmata archaeon]
MKKIVTIGIVMLMVLMGFFSWTPEVSAHRECDPLVIDLIANGGSEATEIDAGDINVWNDYDTLYVKYTVTCEWVLTMTHLHVATLLEDIPTAKNGNPIPGKFEYKTPHEPPVKVYTYEIDLSWDVDTELYIAAHAVVMSTTMTTTTIELTNWGRSTESSTGITSGATLGSAVTAGLALPIDPLQTVWNDGEYQEKNPKPAGIDYASWDHYGYYGVWGPYECRHFQAGFSVPDDVNLDTIQDVILYSPYAAGDVIPVNDNIYVYLNGQYIGHKGTYWVYYGLEPGGRNVGLYPQTDGWYADGSFGGGAGGYIQEGTNTIDIVAEEFCQWGGMDRLNMKLKYYRTETAWGEGTDFLGKNWAMYFTYTVQDPTWDVTGDWVLEFTNFRGVWPHDMTVTVQYSDGSFEGYGGFKAGATTYIHKWTLTGYVSGNTIVFHMYYYYGPLADKYWVDAQGTIACDGTMSGTYVDNGYTNSGTPIHGTWQSISGSAS